MKSQPLKIFLALFAACLPVETTDAFSTALHCSEHRRSSLLLHAGNPNRSPYIMERIRSPANPKVFQEISETCIQAFFNDNPEPTLSIPKQAQLYYLRQLQRGDLKRRRERYPRTNIMLVARALEVATATNAKERPLLLDFNQVVHKHLLDTSQDYVPGQVVGFVEVTQRPYGLPTDQRVESSSLPMRSILTNLSVDRRYRQSGIGSRLVQECERAVLAEWDLREMLLEVEDDNEVGLQFYQRLGYQKLFDDPASRRYNLEGLWLREVRCKRFVLRKQLGGGLPASVATPGTFSGRFANIIFQQYSR